MSARNGGVVSVGIVGLVLLLVGVLVTGLGVSWLYAMQQYSVMLTETFDDLPQVPPAIPMMAWTALAGVSMAVLGIILIRRRAQIVDRWIMLPAAVSDGEPPSRGVGAVTAIGIAGLCLAVIGVSEVTVAAVDGVLFGWDGDSTAILWSGLPFLLVGAVLVLRPRLLSSWWKL